jgi:hypothetical protein
MKSETDVWPAADRKLQKWHKQRRDVNYFHSLQTDAGSHEHHIQLETRRFSSDFIHLTMNIRISGDLPPLQHNLRGSVLVQQQYTVHFRDNLYVAGDRYQQRVTADVRLADRVVKAFSRHNCFQEVTQRCLPHITPKTCHWLVVFYKAFSFTSSVCTLVLNTNLTF